MIEVRPEAGDPARTRLTIDVRGKWTTPWVPMGLALAWLRYVMREHARRLREAM